MGTRNAGRCLETGLQRICLILFGYPLTPQLVRCEFRSRTVNTGGAQLSLKCSPTRLPTNYPHDWHLELRCPHWLERGHLNWDWPNYPVVRETPKSFHASPQ